MDRIISIQTNKTQTNSNGSNLAREEMQASPSSSSCCCFRDEERSTYIRFFAPRIRCPWLHLQRPHAIHTDFCRFAIVARHHHAPFGIPQHFPRFTGRPVRLRRLGLRSKAFSPRGGGGGGGYGRIIINLSGAGLLTYLTVTGKLSWLFDTIFSLWVFLAIFWCVAERFLIKGLCPNCGGEFQVFEFVMAEELQLCPFCSQPFKVENRQFVREEPQFSKKQQGSQQPFEGFQRGFKQSVGSFDKRPVYDQKEKNSGMIVDVEAEVRDKD